jgi:hypothetical protein
MGIFDLMIMGSTHIIGIHVVKISNMILHLSPMDGQLDMISKAISMHFEDLL